LTDLSGRSSVRSPNHTQASGRANELTCELASAGLLLIDATERRKHNQSVLLVRLIAFACAVAVPVATAAADLAQMALASQAQACCDAMQRACAGLSAPDDCCKTPQVAQPAGTTSTIAKALIALVAPALAPNRFTVEAVALEQRSTASAFARAHDPPHLHPLSLRI
jgi:hypothetical protein